MSPSSTFYILRFRTAQALLGLIALAVFAFGAVDVWAFSVIAAATLGLTAAWALRKWRNPFPVIVTALYAPFGLMVVIGGLQLLMGTSQAPYATGGSLLAWLVYLAFLFLAANALADPGIRIEYLRGFLAVVSLACLLGLAQWITQTGSVYWLRAAPGARIFGPFADAEAFAVLIELAFPVALTVALRGGRRQHYYLGACAVMALALAGTRSAVGVAVVAAQLVCVTAAMTASEYRVALHSRRRGPRFVAGLLGAGALGVLLIAGAWSMGLLRVGTAELESVQTVLDRSERVLTRGEALQTSRALLAEKPLLGHGLGSFGQVFSRAAPREDGWYWKHLQSDPLELAIEAGWPALAAQVLLLAVLLLRTRGLNMWGLVIAPLAGAWVHSWFAAPVRTPAVMLAGLALLALAPGLSARVAVKRRRRP